MPYIKSYKELIVWQKSIQLVTKIYLLTRDFPKSEQYGLVSQMRRSAISIPSNIAEGYGRKSSKEYSQFYSIAYGSGMELETQLIITKELSLAKSQQIEPIENLLVEVLKMLNTMIAKMKELNAIR